MAHDISKGQRTGDVLLGEDIDFAGLFLSSAVLDGLNNAGFKRPSPIQLKAIPIGRCGLDLIVQAKSGTGKTCVFSVIALEALDLESSCTQVLVLAPTREIAVQIHGVVTSIGSSLPGLTCHTFIGGLPVGEDKQKLKSCHIAIGTPGRLRQLVEMGALRTESIRLLVLDEADKLMEESFQEQMNWLYSVLAENKQMIALSATYPEVLANHLTTYMRNPTFVRLNSSDPALLGIRQYYSVVPYHPMPQQTFNHKVDSLQTLLSCVTFNQCLVFSNYQMRAQSLSEVLNAKGWPSTYISGSLDQSDRLSAMEKLKELQCRVLISTDLTARGIDAEHVNLVVNLDIPSDHETYLHRIGRAGRFGTYGAAVSLVCMGQEVEQLSSIEKKCSTKVKPLPNPIPSDLAHSSGYVYLDDLVTTERIVTVDSDALGHVPTCNTPTPGAMNGNSRTSPENGQDEAASGNSDHPDHSSMKGKEEVPMVQYESCDLKCLGQLTCAGCDKYTFMNVIDPAHSIYPHAVYRCAYSDTSVSHAENVVNEDVPKRGGNHQVKTHGLEQEGQGNSFVGNVTETPGLNGESLEAKPQDVCKEVHVMDDSRRMESDDPVATALRLEPCSKLSYDHETLKHIGQRPCSECEKYDFCSVLLKQMGEKPRDQPYYCAFRVMNPHHDKSDTQTPEEHSPGHSAEISSNHSDRSTGAKPSVLQYSRNALLEIGRRPCSKCHTYHFHQTVTPVWGKKKKGQSADRVPAVPAVHYCAFAVGRGRPVDRLKKTSHLAVEHPAAAKCPPMVTSHLAGDRQWRSGHPQERDSLSARVAALQAMAPDLSWTPPELLYQGDSSRLPEMRSRLFMSASGSHNASPPQHMSYEDMKNNFEAFLSGKHVSGEPGYGKQETRPDPGITPPGMEEYKKEEKLLQSYVEALVPILHRNCLPSELVCVERQPSPERTTFRKQHDNLKESGPPCDGDDTRIKLSHAAAEKILKSDTSDASCPEKTTDGSQSGRLTCRNDKLADSKSVSVGVQTDITPEYINTSTRSRSRDAGHAEKPPKPIRHIPDPRGSDPHDAVDARVMPERPEDSKWQHCDNEHAGPSFSSCPVKTEDEYTYDDYDASYMYFQSPEDQNALMCSGAEMVGQSKEKGNAECRDSSVHERAKVCHQCRKRMKYKQSCDDSLHVPAETCDDQQTLSESGDPIDTTFAQSFQYFPHEEKIPRCRKQKKKKHQRSLHSDTDSVTGTHSTRSSAYWPQQCLPPFGWSNSPSNWTSPYYATDLRQYYAQQFWNHKQWADYYKKLNDNLQASQHILSAGKTQHDYIHHMTRASIHKTK